MSITQIESKQLGDVAKFVRGINFKPHDVVPESTPGTVACMRTKNVQAELDQSDVWFVGKQFVARDEQFLTQGDILISSANSWNLVGKCCWIPKLPRESTFGGFVTVLRAHEDKVFPRYLFHWFSSPKIQDFVRSFGRQTTNISNLDLNRCLKLPLPLPPLSEQKRIAEILDRAEALRAKRRAALALLDELTQSIFLDMFGDPVTNPKGWPIMEFQDVCDSRLGKMLDAKKQVGDNARPYLRNINVNWGRLDLSTIWTMDFNEKDRREFRLAANDVLICEGGAGVAQTAVWRNELEECYFQKSLHRVRPRVALATSEYIAFLIRMLMRQGSELMRLVSSATIPHLTGVKLKKLRIPVPPIEHQNAFGAAITSLEQQRFSMGNQVANFDQLFASLQHRAFRGEL